MKKSVKLIKRLSIAASIAAVITIPLFAFEWPQENVREDSFFSFFGQKRGNVISNSLVFSDAETAVAADEGQLSIVISEHEDGFNWFESTLGTAVVIAHEDSLLTVYGNLDTDTLNESIYTEEKIKTGTELSTTGNSGWQEKDSFLEFQIIDTKNGNYVNPLILMPRIGKEEPLTLTGISLKNKLGKIYDLESQHNIPAGVYKVYRKRQSKAIPYKTSIVVNGAESEHITYDILTQSQNDLAVIGRNNYPYSEIYPSDDMMLIGELYLPHGKDTISLIVTDFTGKEKSRVFNVTVF